MSWTNALLVGLAQCLDDNGLGRFIPEDEDSVFVRDDTGIILKEMPPSPDRAIVLNTYSPVDDPVQGMGSVMVQFRFRGSRKSVLDADGLADDVFDLLHGARYLDLIPGQPAFSYVIRKSSLDLGADGNDRWERTDNYEFFGARTTTPNRK